MNDTKQRIIESATNLFRIKGCKHVSMDSVSNELHISKRTLYEYFATKEELISACIECLLSQRKVLWDYLYSRTNDPVQTIFHIINNMSVIGKDDYLLMHDLELYYPEIHQRLVCHNDEAVYARMRQFLLQADQRGLLRQGMDLETVCTFFQHIMSKAHQGHFKAMTQEVLQCASLTLLRGILSVETLHRYEQEDTKLNQYFNNPQQ